MENLHIQFGLLVRRTRRTAAMSQQALAERVNLTRTSICNIEAGRQRVSLDVVYRIADALDVAPAALLPPIERRQPKLPIKVRRQLDGRKSQDWAHRVIASATSGSTEEE